MMIAAANAASFDRYAALAPSRRRLVFERLSPAQREVFVPPSAALAAGGEIGGGGLGISLLFFSNRAENAGAHYELLLTAAAAAERGGLEAIWLPERHFNAFGGPYPNPALLCAAVAVRTTRLGIRAGSVVLALHNPLRVVEDWSVVDNLSGGRVGVAIASGWEPKDFQHFGAGAAYDDRRAETLRLFDTVNRLWRSRDPAKGTEPDLRLLPRPVQPVLPMWLTASRSRTTWLAAAERGAGVLSALLEQSRDQLAANIAAYRGELNRHHSPKAGKVTLMLHALLGTDAFQARARAETAMQHYFLSHLNLYRGYLRQAHPEIEVDGLSAGDLGALAARGTARYLDGNALVGSAQSAVPLCRALQSAGVDEIACLVDFHGDPDLLMSTVDELGHLRVLLAAADTGQT